MESILIIDDCDNSRAIISDVLIDAGYYVSDAPSTSAAFEILRNETFNLILCDLHLPFKVGEENAGFEYSLNVGIQTIKELIWVFQWTPVIAITGMGEEDVEKAMLELPGVPVLVKPIRIEHLLLTIRQALGGVRCEAVQ